MTILGILFAVNGAFQFSMFFAFSSGFWRAVPLLLSILSFVVAFGLLLGERWAWILTLLLDIAFALGSIMVLALVDVVGGIGFFVFFMYVYPAYTWLISMLSGVGITQFDPKYIGILPGILGFIVPFVILPLIMIIYLMLPHVKEFFSK